MRRFRKTASDRGDASLHTAAASPGTEEASSESSEAGRRPFRPPTHWLRHLATVLVLGLAVHLLLPQITTLQHSLDVIRGMTWWVVALAAGSTVMSLLGAGILLNAIARMTGDRLRLARGALITLASNSIGLVAGGIVPTGVAASRWVRGSGVGSAGAVVTLWLPVLLYNSVLVVVTALGLIYLLLLHKLTVPLAITFGVILAGIGFVIGAIAWGSRRRDRFTAMVSRVAERWTALRHRPFDPAPTHAAVARIFHGIDWLGEGGWRGPVLGAVLTTFFDMLTLYLLFVAAGHRLSPAVVVTAYGLPMLLAKAPLTTPGGIGIVETGMVALFASLGVPKQVAVVSVLAYRLIAFWLPSLTGFVLIPFLQHVAGGKRGEAVRQAAAEGA
jgi:glycosyltransferase 2 family protein